MTATTPDITRTLAVEWNGIGPVLGFSLAFEVGDWVVDNGSAVSIFAPGREAAALRAYARYIETFIDDENDETRAVWTREIERARADADALETGHLK